MRMVVFIVASGLRTGREDESRVVLRIIGAEFGFVVSYLSFLDTYLDFIDAVSEAVLERLVNVMRIVVSWLNDCGVDGSLLYWDFVRRVDGDYLRLYWFVDYVVEGVVFRLELWAVYRLWMDGIYVPVDIGYHFPGFGARG